MIFDACRKQRLQKCTVRKTVLTRNYDTQKTSPLMNKRFGFQKKTKKHWTSLHNGEGFDTISKIV